MPGVLKSLKILALVSFSAAASENGPEYRSCINGRTQQLQAYRLRWGRPTRLPLMRGNNVKLTLLIK
jgi:hypothetical protein